MRLAIVHDALVNTGGAERVVSYLREAFPDAPIFTSAYLPGQVYAELRSANVQTLPGSRFVDTERRCKQLWPLWLLGFARLRLDDFDFVLSSTTWGAKFIRPGKHTQHACYCYAPFRLAWAPQSYTSTSLPVNTPQRKLVAWVRPLLRRLDHGAMRRVDRVATTCGNMAKQIGDCYGRQARIIYAPIRLSDYSISKTPGEYYLTVARLMSHKRVDLAVKACTALRRQLLVVGEGPERGPLGAVAGDCVHFLGRVSDEQLKSLYANCRAVIFPSDEDYGLVPLEAQASGRPVIAYGGGGALETIVEHQTGVFFPEQTVDSTIDALMRFEQMLFDPTMIRLAAQKFDIASFKRQIVEFVLNC